MKFRDTKNDLCHNSRTWILALVSLFLLPAAASAEDWAFRRSYYTHQLSADVAATAPMPVSRSAYRIPTRPNNTGGTVRYSWRSNNIHLHSGGSHDTQVLWERSVEYRP